MDGHYDYERTLLAIVFELLSAFDLTFWQWFLAAMSGVAVGASKSGLAGVGFLAFPLLADVFGARVSTGVALPMLLLADVFAVSYYNRDADWKHLVKLMPCVFVGLLIALIVGKVASDRMFGMLFAVTIIVGIVIMIWRDLRAKTLDVPKSFWFSAIMGLSAGFATMIGNAAGPIMSLYLLSMRMPKAVFIGTGAWFYMIVNTAKIPLHLYVWQTISTKTLAFNLVTAPFIIFGILGGIWLVKRIPEKVYRILVFASVILAAAVLVVKFFA
ncbi:MAG: sulfite exporter TauE/SafE family protein [Desulfobacteraceae bacterium]